MNSDNNQDSNKQKAAMPNLRNAERSAKALRKNLSRRKKPNN